MQQIFFFPFDFSVKYILHQRVLCVFVRAVWKESLFISLFPDFLSLCTSLLSSVQNGQE